MTFRSFEEISAWQSARKLVAAIYRVSKEGEFARDFGLRNQIRRAALSVMANIAEGFSYRSDKEFAKFLLIAKASALEVQSHLYAALDQGYLTEIEFRHLYSLAAGCAKQLSSLISFLLKRQAG
ncbi:MAG: four helix bundle protein [Bacillati bacterium ANGP1]|uniref:Four helix bundle protein n=1 Tax=Candidatus Segetimicrobium genomatis TaxID=2569760 RepID=A0A537LT76_9BACT|nr:MAG: four helix bundle protein [Terrabacteria group bacterium ANGP1]